MGSSNKRNLPWLCLLALLSVVAIAETVVDANGVADSGNADPALKTEENGNVDKEEKTGGVHHGERQVDWIRAMGGFVNDKFGIRKLEPDNPQSFYEVYATGDIAKDELILILPRACIISTFPEEKTGDALECATARNLYREMQLGNESQYGPYVTYLKETQAPGQLPSAYSEVGKALLWKIVGGSTEEDQQLPPSGPTGWLDYEWKVLCQGSDNPDEQHAALLVVQRAWDDLLLPVYDMMSHRDGHWLNTKSNSVHDTDEEVQVRASRDIRAGEAIYTSYDQCEDCGGRLTTYGTPEMLRDYGFIEQFPQKWIFHDQQVGFKLHEIDGMDDLQLEWVLEPADYSDLTFFEDQIDRLTKLGETDGFQSRPDDVPEREWNVIMGYYKAILVAMKRLVEVVVHEEESTCNFEEGTCQSHYDALNEITPELSFNLEACDRRVSLNFSGFDSLETIRSPYQEITFDIDPQNNDVCFDLDGILQICDDYRPHYHEMVVHYTARFIDKVERVLWVGGGDSMLLYEILKYPSLELVVGLELDQAVTRGSFKYFGTQPHWDNPRVQWWYGDAAKSMLLLPKELYGSFDMVLVDLSETVMSMTVTKDLDILGALSLLIKPDGVFLKNEMYQEKMSDLFRYMLQVHYYDVPRLCSQCLCLGSNKIDFMQKQLTEHNVSPMLSNLQSIDESHYEIYNDYTINPASKKYCKEDDVAEVVNEQETSPGIVMVLEAENTTLELTPANVKSAIHEAVEKEGLFAVATMTSDDNTRTVVVLREGYIVARALAEKNYIAYDLHLWSSFSKLESLKYSLLASSKCSLGSASSFRIVAGGMFGVETWKEDETSRGPKFTQECDGSVEVPREATMDAGNWHAIVEETMTLLPWGDVVAVVLCGSNIKLCDLAATVASHGSVSKVIPILACPDIEGYVFYLEDGERRTKACEQKVVAALEEALIVETVAFVALDPSAPFALAQIFDRITSKASKKRWFADDLMAIAPVLKLDETWRRVFVDHFRYNFFKKSSFRSEVLFNSTNSTMEMDTFLSGDKTFVLQLAALNKKIEARTGLVSEIRAIHQGAPDFQEDFEPSQFFLSSDYDQVKPLEQWNTQQPWGLQTVFQINVNGEFSKAEPRKLLENVLGAMSINTTKPIEEFTNLGDGSVLFATWRGGDAIVLYDGRKLLTVNLFTIKEDVPFASKFANQVTMKNPLSSIGLRDQMPRGYGRVVNFLSDVEPRVTPRWAAHLM